MLTQDLVDIIQLSDVLDRPHYILVPGTPTDVPSTIVDLIETKALLLNTSKHFITEAQNAENCKKVIEMCAAVAGGLDKLVEKPFMTMLVTLTSPLHFRQDVSDLIIETAKVGLPLFIESGPMAGGTGPATMAGNLICANAEILNAFVLAKAVNPEVPLIYASWARLLDMKVATCSHGGPEFAMLRTCTSQLAKYYGLPCGGGSVLADTKSIDVQLGMGKDGNGASPRSRRNEYVHGNGPLRRRKRHQPRNACNRLGNHRLDRKECCAALKLRKRRATSLYLKKVGPGGDFVRSKHTLENYKKESFIPNIMDRGYLALDKDPLAKEMRKRAKKMYPKLMKNYKAPEIPAEVIARIDEIIAR